MISRILIPSIIVGMRRFSESSSKELRKCLTDPASNGDLNILGPFIPFASPVDRILSLTAKVKVNPSPANEAALAAAQASKPQFPNHAFKCLARVFKEEKVGMVVRLNDAL